MSFWTFLDYNLFSLNPVVRDGHLKFLLQNQSVGEALFNFFVRFQACQGWDIAPSLPGPGAVALSQQKTPSSEHPASPSTVLPMGQKRSQDEAASYRLQKAADVSQFLPHSVNRGCLSVRTQLEGYRGALPPPYVFYHPQTELAPASEAQPNPAGCFREDTAFAARELLHGGKAVTHGGKPHPSHTARCLSRQKNPREGRVS